MNERNRFKGEPGTKGELTKVKVEIFGESYSVKGQESPENIRLIAGYVDKKMRQIADRNHRLSNVQIAVLAALNIADELRKLQEDYDNLVKITQAGENLQK
ncbi:MAG: cell division protein ZapA [Clostridia bacterium]|nr:cell division protein ZapA [Clostridia bacterium]